MSVRNILARHARSSRSSYRPAVSVLSRSSLTSRYLSHPYHITYATSPLPLARWMVDFHSGAAGTPSIRPEAWGLPSLRSPHPPRSCLLTLSGPWSLEQISKQRSNPSSEAETTAGVPQPYTCFNRSEWMRCVRHLQGIVGVRCQGCRWSREMRPCSPRLEPTADSIDSGDRRRPRGK